MKRDMDLIREILLRIEKSPTGEAPSQITVDGYSEDQVGYHILLAVEAGLVVGDEITGGGDAGPVGVATRLTWDGHEFLDAAREPQRWEEARRLIEQVGGATIQIWIGVLTKIVTNQIGN